MNTFCCFYIIGMKVNNPSHSHNKYTSRIKNEISWWTLSPKSPFVCFISC